VAALLASLMFGGSAHAWGDNAHKVICAIAFDLAEPHTQDEIQDLIALDPKYSSFSDSCVFPDHPRIRAPEHFVNLPRDSNGLTSDQCPGTDRCVLSAIQDDSKVLSSKTVPDLDRLIALKSLGHWVGDIHQPLHVSFADDRGGNGIKVSGGGCNNLHATWDRCLVDDAVGSDPQKAATQLLSVITPDMKAKWSTNSPPDWANESFAISEALQTGYCEMHGASCDRPSGPVTISSAYLDVNKPVAREQLEKAGVRLAHLLDVLFK
jgi:hypothetical protein